MHPLQKNVILAMIHTQRAIRSLKKAKRQFSSIFFINALIWRGIRKGQVNLEEARLHLLKVNNCADQIQLFLERLQERTLQVRGGSPTELETIFDKEELDAVILLRKIKKNVSDWARYYLEDSDHYLNHYLNSEKVVSEKISNLKLLTRQWLSDANTLYHSFQTLLDLDNDLKKLAKELDIPFT